MSVARFKIFARLDQASRASKGTVTIDRERSLFAVRPLRRKRVYELPLADVASMAVRWIIYQEVQAKRAAKKAARRSR